MSVEPDSDPVLRLKQQIITAVTDDPDAVPNLLIDLGLVDPVSAGAIREAMVLASGRVEATP